MKVFFDTSVLVAALVQPHPMHGRALPWLKKAKAGEFDMAIAGHTLAELYAVLTTLPVSPRIMPAMALRLIHESVEPFTSVSALSPLDYLAVVRHVSEHNLSGGVIYDALILKSALKFKADRLITFNVSDFKRIWPDADIQIISP